MTVTMKTIPTITSALKKRKPSTLAKDSDKPLSPKEAVMQLAPTLLAKKEEGFTTTELVDILAEHGIAVKAHNLTRYLREYGAATGNTSLGVRNHGSEIEAKRASLQSSSSPDKSELG